MWGLVPRLYAVKKIDMLGVFFKGMCPGQKRGNADAPGNPNLWHFSIMSKSAKRPLNPHILTNLHRVFQAKGKIAKGLDRYPQRAVFIDFRKAEWMRLGHAGAREPQHAELPRFGAQWFPGR